MTQIKRRRPLAIDLRRLPALAEVRALAAQPYEFDLGPDVAQHPRDLGAHLVGDQVALVGAVEHHVEAVGFRLKQDW